MNWFQLGYSDRPRATENAAAMACISVIAKTTAMLPLHHKRRIAGNSFEILRGSQAARVLQTPNEYQSSADFWLRICADELTYGNGYAIIIRNGRTEIDSIHVADPQATSYIVDRASGEIFYRTTGPALNTGDRPLIIPARDIIHLRQHTGTHPLEGITPLRNAALSIDTGNLINQQQRQFFANMSRPSGVLVTEKELTRRQRDEIKEHWQEQSSRINAGATPLLSHGLEWKSISISNVDAAVIEAYKMSVEDVARVFGVPLPMIGVMSGATFNNVLTLIRHWLATGLQFYLRHIEQAMRTAFRLSPDECFTFDTDVILQSDMKDRLEALQSGIKAGLYSNNEARDKEGLPPVEYGDEPRVQQQDVPLSFYYDERERLAAEAARLDAETEAARIIDITPEPADEEGEDDEIRAIGVQRLIERELMRAITDARRPS